MPRFFRRVAPGSVQHLISRFVNREFLFDLPDARQEYLARAQRAFARTDWTPIGYALMSSHVHWLVRAGSDSSDRLVRSLHVGFAMWLNRSAARLGPVFADRHRNVECDSQTALAMLAYIHNNPVRARLVGDPGDSAWTSHRAYVGLDVQPAWLDVRLGLRLCGFELTVRGRAAFHEAVVARAHEPRQALLTAANLQSSLRNARRANALPVELASPRVFANDSGLEQSIDCIIPAFSPSRVQWSGSPADVLKATAQWVGLSEAEICSRSRERRVCAARRQALLVWVHGLSRPAIEMARALGVTSAAASEHLRESTHVEREIALRAAQALRTAR